MSEKQLHKKTVGEIQRFYPSEDGLDGDINAHHYEDVGLSTVIKFKDLKSWAVAIVKFKLDYIRKALKECEKRKIIVSYPPNRRIENELSGMDLIKFYLALAATSGIPGLEKEAVIVNFLIEKFELLEGDLK